MTIRPEILKWSLERPLWQQDALRRLVDHASVREEDLIALITLCKQEHGITDGTPLAAIPLTAAAPDTHDPGKEQVVLSRVTEVSNVNALRAGQHLKISDIGLTVVYGENGAGKSGYVRILKQLCRARGGRDAIHPNVYLEDEAPVSAVLEFTIGATPDHVTWNPQCLPVKALGEVSIFDAKSASVYVNKENDVAYLPQGMDLFPRLVAVTEEIRRRIEHEIALLEGQRDRFDGILTNTKVWEFLENLGAKDVRVTLGKLMSVSDVERAQLTEWRLEEKRLKADDAAGRARANRLVASRIRSLRQRLQAAGIAVSDTGEEALRVAIGAAAAAREAARIASASALADAPLRGVGSDTWKQLWEIARKFATMEPALEQEFPPTEQELCVLCQQPIVGDSANRLARFEQYVRSQASAEADNADAALGTMRRNLAALSMDKILDQDGATELEAMQLGLAAKVRSAIEILERRRKPLLEASDAATWPTLPATEGEIDGVLEKIAATQIEEAVRYEQAVDPAAVANVTRAIQEIEARTALAGLEARVLAQIEREDRRTRQKACVAATNTAAVTKRNTELLKDAVTAPLAAEPVNEFETPGGLSLLSSIL